MSTLTANPQDSLQRVVSPRSGVIAASNRELEWGAGAELPPMLDACCGSRMFWFDRANPHALYMDKREEQHDLCDGRELKIAPDVCADFTKMPFPDESFWLVVFDPPHMNSLGENSWLAKKYGRLIGEWRDDIREGFSECIRVLKPNGTLVFKWNTTDIPLDEVLALAPFPPAFGHTTGRQAKTVWATFFKAAGVGGDTLVRHDGKRAKTKLTPLPLAGRVERRKDFENMSKTSNGKGGAAVAGAARGSAYARNDADGYLQAEVEGRELVIRIGVDRLAYCLRTDDGPMHGCKIRSKYGAAKDMARMMERDDEIGQTPIGTFLAEMAKAAAEDGSIHVSMPNDQPHPFGRERQPDEAPNHTPINEH